MQVEQLIIRAGKKPIAPGGLCGWTAAVSTHNPVLWGLSTASGAAVLGEAHTLASVAEMLWRVTPKVPAQKVLWNPCAFCLCDLCLGEEQLYTAMGTVRLQMEYVPSLSG